MVLLLPLLLVGVFAYMWFARRGSTLTRDCLWRMDRSLGPGLWRCAVCGATCRVVQGKEPRHCLRPSPPDNPSDKPARPPAQKVPDEA